MAQDQPTRTTVETGSAFAGAGVAWRPSELQLSRSRLRRFMASHGIESLPELHRRSVADVGWFWDAVVRDLDLEFYTPYERVLDLGDGAPWARWFVGGRYNYVHNALDRHARGIDAERLAVVWEGEDGAVRRLTYAELLAETDRLAWGLRRLGVGPGDRVGIFMPMVPETVVATLACGKIGAIYTPIFSGYAAPAVASRLNDSGAKVLITADGFYRRGTVVPMGRVAVEAANLAPSVEKIVLVNRIGETALPPDDRIVAYDDAVGGTDGLFPTLPTSADDPFMIIYTSGT